MRARPFSNTCRMQSLSISRAINNLVEKRSTRGSLAWPTAMITPHFLFFLASPSFGSILFSPPLFTMVGSAAAISEDHVVKSPEPESERDVPVLQRALVAKRTFRTDKKGGDDGKKCWIFTHMPKSGGSTIRDLMRSKWGEDKCIKYGSPEWKNGEQHARRIMGKEWRIFAGSHAEALRRYGGERCQWFTLFRHPIARVVSAYYYCKHAPIDPLCATSMMKANRVDLLTFVQHWGNFGLRLFSLSFGDHSPDNVMAWAKKNKKSQRTSAWYLQRKFMEAQSDRHDTPDAALYEMLAPAKDLLNTSFAAVGILENFNATLLLFDRALKMPGETWPQWYQKIGKRNVDQVHKQEEEAALAEAWTDPRLEHFLKLDLELYGHAVKVHHAMLERYGLE